MHRFPDKKRKGASFRGWVLFVQDKTLDSAASVTTNTVEYSAHFGPDAYVPSDKLFARMTSKLIY